MKQRFVGGVLSLLVCVSSVSFARFVEPMVRSDRREWRIEKQNAFAFPGRKNTEAKRREVWHRQIQRRKDTCACVRDKRINKRNEKQDSYKQHKKDRKELKLARCAERRQSTKCQKCEAARARVAQACGQAQEGVSEKVVKSEPKKHKKVKQKVAKNKPKKEKRKKIKPAVVASEDDHNSDDEFLLDEEDWPLAVI